MNTYQNPIYPATFADPAILRTPEGFYLYGTMGYSDYKGEGKPFLSRGPILFSKDLCHYEYVGEIFDDKEFPRWGTKDACLWAPDIIKIGSTYVLYYSLSILFDPNASIGVATSSSPKGPFHDHGPLLRSLEVKVNNSIDPTVFRGYDGQLYIIWGSYRGIYGSKLSEDGLSLLGEKVALAGFDQGTIDLDTYEASYMVKRNGLYYLLFSTGKTLDGDKCTYHVVSCKSRSPLGPYSDSQGHDMFGRNQGDLVVDGLANHFVGTGHCCVHADDAETYWIFYHGVEISPKYPSGASERIMAMDPLKWDPVSEMPFVEKKLPSYQVVKEGPVLK
jgi:Beta-xylosidase